MTGPETPSATHPAGPGEGLGGSETLAVIGLGTMGCGIAVAALANGVQVLVVDHDEAATTAGMAAIAARLERYQEIRGGNDRRGTGGSDPDDDVPVAERAVQGSSGPLAGRLSALGDMRQIPADVALVIEAVPEDWAIKRAVLAELSSHTPAIIATNTSAFSIDKLATSVERPERFLGVHFFNPAEWIPGVEVIPGASTTDETVAAAMEPLRSWAKEPALVTDNAGFVANRLQLALFAECMRCLEEGVATIEEIDTVVRSTFGFRLGAYGPFAIADMAGLDVYESILDTLAADFGDRFEATPTLRSMVADGRLGAKVGRGFRAYSDEEAAALVEARDHTYARLLESLVAPD